MMASMTDPSPISPIINAFWRGGAVVLVRRDASGKRVLEQRPAEHCIILGGDTPEPLLRSLRASRYCIGAVREPGGWWRTRWRYDRSDPGAAPVHVRVAKRLEEEHHVRTYEADVSPVRRFMTDTGVKVLRPRACYLDIETDSRVPFSRQLKDARVLAWVVIAEDGSRTDAGLLEADTDADERAMLLRLWSVLAPYDQVRGWNLDRFDRPMVEERSKLHRIAVEPRQWLWLDHLELYRRFNAHAAKSGAEKQSMALAAIGKSLGLGGKSEGVDGSMSWQLWSEGPQGRAKLLNYCWRDTDLMRLIENKTGYIELFQTLVEATDVLPDTHGISPMGQVEGFLFRLGKERCMHFRSQFEFGEYDAFAGAFVMQPKWKGYARNVQVADFAGMYPSIITTWNLSPETHRPEIKLIESDTRPSYLMHVPRKRFPLPPGHCEVPLLGHVFVNEPKGILPIAVDALGELRAKWQKLKATLPPGTPEWNAADRKADAYKIARNSFYGVTGSPMSRFFLREVAESTSQGGVWLAKETIAFFEQHGAFVGYGDSVAMDRTVVVRRPDGRTSILPVADLFELGNVVEERGKEFAVFEGWSALARDEQGFDGWFPLRHVVRHRGTGLLHRIETKDGQVEVTDDHSLMVGNTQMKPTEFIASGALLNKVRAQRGRAVSCFDLLDYTGSFCLVREGLGRWKGERIVNRFESLDTDRVMLTGFHNATHSSVQRYYERGSGSLHALLRVVGAYISEGSASLKGVTTSRFVFSISQQERAWLDSLAKDIGVFTDGVKLTGPLWSPGSNVHYLRSGAAMLPCLFSALCGHKSRGKRLPDFVYDLDADDFAVLWGSLVDDGSRMPNGVELYTTISQQLAAGLSYVLDQHGFEHAIHYRASKGSWTIRTRVGLNALNSRRPNRVKLRHTTRPVAGEFVYDLCVDGAHTFVDGIGRVLLHNTDSSMVTNLDEAEFGRVVELCNTELYPRLLREKGCARNTIKLEFEKGFDRIVFVAAKKYVGKFSHYKGKRATADSEPEVKGLEWKRGDAARLTRELQGEVIALMMGGDDPPEADVFVPVIERWQARILTEPLVCADVKIAKRLSKALSAYTVRTKQDGKPAAEPPHVRVARELKKRGADVGEGTKIEYVVLDADKNMIVPACDWNGECDRHYVWEQMVYPATQRLLAAAYPDFDWNRWAVTRPRRVLYAAKREARKVAATKVQGRLFE